MGRDQEDDAREEAEALEEEVIAEELAARHLRDVSGEWLDDGVTVRVMYRERTVTGVVVHAGEDFLTLRTPVGDLDVRYRAISSMVAEAAGHGRLSRPPTQPARFSGRLREVQITRTHVVLGGPALEDDLLIVVVAKDHLLTESRGRTLVVPMDAVDSVLRAPSASRG